jgi:N-acetylglutamate synthase-like GNAT family acetyltransferase
MIIRDARRADVPEIVALLADDPLGAQRESADISCYLAAFAEIEANPMHQLLVVEQAGTVIGCCQLTILSSLSRGGARRALVEAVRVAAPLRCQGIGARLMAECEMRARDAGAGMMQLTTDKTRKKAHKFFKSLGYRATHKGMKKPL